MIVRMIDSGHLPLRKYLMHLAAHLTQRLHPVPFAPSESKNVQKRQERIARAYFPTFADQNIIEMPFGMPQYRHGMRAWKNGLDPLKTHAPSQLLGKFAPHLAQN